MLIQKRVGIDKIVRMLIYILPSIIALTIPMAVLLGIIIGLNRLASDSEIVALRAGGISIYKLIMPVMIFSLFMWIINSYIMIYALPQGNSKLVEMQLKIATSKAILKDVKPRVFNDSLPNQVIYISDITTQGNWWRKIFIFQDKIVNRPAIILAERGKPLYDNKSGRLGLRLYNGTLYETNLIRPKKNDRISSFGQLNMLLTEGKKDIEQTIYYQKDERSMSIRELWQNIQKKKGRNYVKARIINKKKQAQSFLIQLLYYDEKKQAQSLVNFIASSSPRKAKEISIPYYLPSSAQNSIIKIKLWQLDKSDKRKVAIFEKNLALDKLLETNRLNTKKDFIAAEKIEDSAFRINRLSLGELNQPDDYRSLKVELHKKFSIPFACIIFGILGLPLGMSFQRSGKSAGYVLGLIIFLFYYVFLMNGEVLADKGKISPFLGMWAANIFFALIGIAMLIQRGRATRFFSNAIYYLSKALHRINKKLKKQKKTTKKKRTLIQKKTRVLIQFPRLKWKFPNILDRYIIITFLKIYLLVFIAIYSVFALVDFVDINEEIERRHLPYSLMMDYFKFKFPQILSYIIPITTLMAALITISILSKFKEIVAIKAAGISIFRVFFPLIVTASVASGIAFLIQDNILPYSNQRLGEITHRIKGGPTQTYHKGSRWVFGKNNRIFHFFAQDLQEQVINRFSVFDFSPDTFTLTRRIFAQEVKWNSSEDQWIEFKNGWIQNFAPQEVPKLETFDFHEEIDIEENPSYFRQEIKLPDEMNYSELRDHIRELRRWGYNSLSHQVDLHWKISFPFLSLIFTLLGMPFSLKIERKGTLTGIFLSVALVVVYWNFMVAFKELGSAGILPPLLAAWAPNIIFGIGGGHMILITRT